MTETENYSEALNSEEALDSYVIDENLGSDSDEEGFEILKERRIRYRPAEIDLGDLEDYDLTPEEMDVLREITESYNNKNFDSDYSSYEDVSSEVEYHYEPEWEID